MRRISSSLAMIYRQIPPPHPPILLGSSWVSPGTDPGVSSYRYPKPQPHKGRQTAPRRRISTVAKRQRVARLPQGQSEPATPDGLRKPILPEDVNAHSPAVRELGPHPGYGTRPLCFAAEDMMHGLTAGVLVVRIGSGMRAWPHKWPYRREAPPFA